VFRRLGAGQHVFGGGGPRLAAPHELGGGVIQPQLGIARGHGPRKIGARGKKAGLIVGLQPALDQGEVLVLRERARDAGEQRNQLLVRAVVAVHIGHQVEIRGIRAGEMQQPERRPASLAGALHIARREVEQVGDGAAQDRRIGGVEGDGAAPVVKGRFPLIPGLGRPRQPGVHAGFHHVEQADADDRDEIGGRDNPDRGQPHGEQHDEEGAGQPGVAEPRLEQQMAQERPILQMPLGVVGRPHPPMLGMPLIIRRGTTELGQGVGCLVHDGGKNRMHPQKRKR